VVLDKDSQKNKKNSFVHKTAVFFVQNSQISAIHAIHRLFLHDCWIIKVKKYP